MTATKILLISQIIFEFQQGLHRVQIKDDVKYGLASFLEFV